MEESIHSGGDDVIDLLREKVRTQAQRLRQLEQYKILCEQRIQDLMPGHTLPVKPEDIGSECRNDLIEELQYAKSKIERLQQELYSNNTQVPLAENYTFPHPSTDLTFAQLKELYSAIYFQHSKALQEKKNLEDCLKAEIQLSEEQKTYIDVLKQSIESNSVMSICEFKDTIRQSKESSFVKGIKFESLEEFENHKAKSLDEDPTGSNMQEYMKEREKTDLYLQEAAEALQYAEDEVQKLEVRNSKLLEELDYFKENEKRLNDLIEEFEEKKKQMINTIEKLERNENQISYDKGKLEEKAKEIEGVNKELKDKLKKVEDQYEELEKSYKKLEIQSVDGERALKDLQLTQRSKDSQTRTLENDLEVLRLNKKELSGKISSLENDVKMLNKNLEVTRTDLFETKEKLYQTNSKNTDLESQCDKYMKKSTELEFKLEKSDQYLKSKEETIIKLKKQFSESQAFYEKKTKEFQDTIIDLTKKSNEFQLKNTTLDSKYKKNDEILTKLKSDLEKSSKDLQNAKIEIQNYREQLNKSFSFKEQLESEVKSLEYFISQERSARNSLAEDTISTKIQIQELEKDKTLYMTKSLMLENEIEDMKIEYENFKLQNIKILADLTQESRSKKNLQDENIQYKETNALLENYRYDIETSKKTLVMFCNNFGSVCLGSLSFNSLISEQLKEQIFKNNKDDNVSIAQWVEIMCNELEILLRGQLKFKEESALLRQQIENFKEKFKCLQEDYDENDVNRKALITQIESLGIDYEKLITENQIISNRLQITSTELNNLRKKSQNTKTNYKTVFEEANEANCKIFALKKRLENETVLRKKCEIELSHLNDEKDLLNKVLIRLEKCIEPDELENIYSSILNSRNVIPELQRFSLVKTSKDRDLRSFSYDLYQPGYDFS
ncbi:hypothetical protein SteCoe_11294 [Stentor coeruleus]|uniref:Uncharacterized protein n=1 Tax=Stentor coeruleus TaxID=5963 RepID=A0A1R2CDH9_9CILI|nr:hypothetical protein SteCoe_11294 [Stentor coeruleus]